ncbi:MAG TPA: acyl carrier protein [Pyrinomonadaceae bacterium]|nr:acyl carrier protein [Pyrinomonadaceae bacterium]
MTLEEFFGDILEVAPASLIDDVSQSSLGSWDSLAHINIITGLEEVYGVQFSTTEIQSLKSLGDARRMLRQKGVEV